MERFGKDHKHVLESISNICGEISTAEFSALFKNSSYKASNGKTNPEYLLTRDGFSLLAMGFTGAKTLKWKIKYIEAFNKMEEALRKQLAPTGKQLMVMALIEANIPNLSPATFAPLQTNRIEP